MKEKSNYGTRAALRRIGLFLVCFLFGIGAYADDTYTDDQGLTYTLDAGNLTATVSDDASLTATEVAIPETITADGTTYTVTAIGDSAFYANTTITKVTMSDKITSIGSYAFARCTVITDMNLSTGTTSLGKAAFWYCSAWATEVTIPSGVTEVPESLFCYCKALTSITLHDNITSIGSYAFSYCQSWAGELTIPSGVTRIPIYAFNYCQKLTSVTLHDNITFIGGYAFNYCTSLACSITMPTNLDTLGMQSFGTCSLLTAVDLSPATKLTVIQGTTFQNCTSLTSLTLPENLDSIGTSAFLKCSSLTSVTLPEKLRAIGIQAFRGCSVLAKIEIPASVEMIKYSAFYNCTTATEIDILGPVESMAYTVFYGCLAVQKVYLRGQITYDDYQDFYFGTSAKACSTTDVYAYMSHPPTRSSTKTSVSWGPYALASATLHVPEGCADNFKSGNSYNSYWAFTNVTEDLSLDGEEEDELESSGLDWIEITLGTDTFPGGYTRYYFYYDADTTGTLVMKGTQVPYPPYSDVNLTNQLDYSYSTVSGNQIITFDVTEGKRYYFSKYGATSDATTYTVKIQDPNATPQVESVSPEEYSTLSVTGSNTVQVIFDMDVDVASATISRGTTSTTLEVNQTYKSTASVDYGTALYDMISNNVVSEGDTVTITFTGIAAADDETKLYGDDGTLEIKYKAPAAPVELSTASLPETFYSYWESGDDGGKLVLTFSGNLYEGTDTVYQAGARITFGDTDNSDCYVEEVGTTVSGNTLTVDFTGKQRNRAAMESTSLYYIDAFGSISEDSLRAMVVKIYKVYDADTSFVYTGVQGNTGSYTYTIPFEEVLAWQFTPEDGGSIAGVDTLQIDVENIEVLSYDGVAFGYTYQNTAYTDTIAVADILSTANSDSLTTMLEVPVPTYAQSAIDVTASLVNASSIYEDSLDISASYDALNFTMIYPTAEAIDTIFSGDTIEVTTGINSRIGYMFYLIRNNTTNEQIVTRSTMTYDSSSDSWKAENYFNRAFLVENEYTIEFYMYTSSSKFSSSNYYKNILAYGEHAFAGATQPYVYSDYEFVSGDPEPGSYLDSAYGLVLSYTYSGPVNIDPETSFALYTTQYTLPFETLTPSSDAITASDGKQYAKTWSVTFPTDSLLQLKGSSLQVSLAPSDSLGRRVLGELGTDDQTYTIYEYENDFGIEDLDFTPERSSMVYQLDTLYATFEEGINVSWLVSFSNMQLLNEAGEEVAHVLSGGDQYYYLVIPDEYADDNSYVATSIRLPLSATITEPGDYSLILPRKSFILDQDQEAFYYKADTVTWSVVDSLAYTLVPDSILPVPLAADEVDNDDAATVDSISEIAIYYSEAVHLTADEITVTDNLANYTAKLAVSGNDSNIVTITLDEPLSSAATLYEVIIPQGTIINEAAYTSELFTGLANPDTTLYYLTPVPDQSLAGNVSITPEEGTVDSLYLFVLSFDDYTDTYVGKRDAADEAPYVRDADGNKVATGTIEDDNTELYKSTITLSDVVTEGGDYTLVILPGTYWLGGENSWNWNGDTLTFAYTVVPPAEATITITAVEPENEDTVEQVYDLYFSVDIDAVYVNEDMLSDISIYNRTTYTTYEASQIWKVKGSSNQFGVAVSEAITDEGVLVVAIPEGVVGDLDAYNGGFTTGNVNIAAAFYYYISTEEEATGNGTVTIDPEEGTVDSLSVFTITFEDHSLIAPTWWYYPYLTDESGSVVYTWTFNDDYEIPFDWSTWTGSNYVTLTMPETVTAAGTYTLVVPDSVFNFDDSSTNVNEALEFTYAISETTSDETTAINGVDAGEGVDDEPTYNLAGQRVNATTKGILVRRGKKFVNK